MGEWSDKSPDQIEAATGVIDHIGFRPIGATDMIEHLTKLDIDFKERQVDDQGLYQPFLFDPNGVKTSLTSQTAK